METERQKAECEKYNAIAKKDRFYFCHNHGKDITVFVASFMAAVGLKTVLDVGTGNGAFLFHLANVMAGAGTWSEDMRAHGVDFAYPELLGIPIGSAKKYTRGVTLHAAHGTSLPFADHSIDLVTSFDFLEHVWPEDVPTVLAEMERVGRGRLITSISYQPSNWRQFKDLHRTVESKEWWHRMIGRWFQPVIDWDAKYIFAGPMVNERETE